jgi:hypothetical protein
MATSFAASARGSFWPVASFRGDATIRSLSERSGQFGELRLQNRIYEYAL